MTDTAWGFIGGFMLASAGWFVVLSVAVKNWEKQAKALKRKNFRLGEAITHFENMAHPDDWFNADDVAINKAKKERIYDKYPELLRPGTEVVVIDEEDDIPPMPGTDTDE